MIINRIYIREFAGLSDTEISLDNGLNIIKGDNESGKSSILGFIRFVFYGLPPMKGSDNITERERSLSWTTGNASGFIEIEEKGELYRLERNHMASGGEVGKVIDMKTGAQVFRGEEIWKRFPGVPSSVFDSVCCVKQQKVGYLDSEGVKSAIENLLMSGDEAINTGLALKRLEKARKELMLKKGQGGVIYELERRENEIADKLEKAKQNAGQIIALQASVDKYRAIAMECRRDLENAGNRLHACESCIKLERFDELHSCEDEINALKKSEEDFIAKYGRDGKLPDTDYINTLASLSRKLGACDGDLAVAKAHVTEANAGNKGDALAAARNEDIEKAGGVEKIIGKYKKYEKKRKNTLITAIILCIIGLGAAVIPIILTLFLKEYIPSWMTSSIAYAISAIGILMLIAGISLIPVSAKQGKKAEKVIKLYGFEGKIKSKTIEKDFSDFAVGCADAHAANITYQRRISEADEEMRAAEKEMLEAKEKCAECMRAFSDEDLPEDSDDLEKAALKKADFYTDIVSQYKELHSKTVLAEQKLKILGDELKNDDEASLRTHLLPEAEGLTEIGINKLTLEKEMQSKKLDAVIEKLNESEKNLAVLQMTAENPARLALELESAKKDVIEAKKRYDAVLLAYETIEGAGESLRQNITPRLRASAGNLLSVLTDGRYTDIGIDNDFNCVVTTSYGTKGVDLLSGGTRDTVYFALRIALMEILFGNSLPPLILDEVCAQLDDSRTVSTVNMLKKLGDGGLQSILFTSQGREGIINGKHIEI